MSRRLSVHPEARDELREAILYYRAASPQVAMEFVEIYEEALAAIVKAPKSNPLIFKEYRRKVLRKFPFSMFYTITESEIRLLAVAHQKREPFYWLERR